MNVFKLYNNILHYEGNFIEKKEYFLNLRRQNFGYSNNDSCVHVRFQIWITDVAR